MLWVSSDQVIESRMLQDGISALEQVAGDAVSGVQPTATEVLRQGLQQESASLRLLQHMAESCELSQLELQANPCPSEELCICLKDWLQYYHCDCHQHVPGTTASKVARSF